MHDVEVAKETVRKWFAGDTRPRQRPMQALAKILKVDEGWLVAGKPPEFTESQRKTQNVVAGAAVNLVAGFVQMGGGHPSFPQEDDTVAKSNRVDLYAIIRGAHYRFHIATIIGGADGHFMIPAEARDETIVLGVVPLDGFQVRIYELDWETIQNAGVRKPGGYEVRLSDGPFKEVKSFSERL